MRADSAAGEPLRQEIIIGERNALAHAGLAALLERHGALIVAAADCGDGLARLAMAHPQALVIADIALLRSDAPLPAARLIVLAADAAQASLTGPLVDQAAGLVLRTSGAGPLRACVTAVAAGCRWHDPTRPERHDGLTRLTPRERDIVRLIATGARNRSIAARLNITEGTVKMHLHNIYAKLGLESRTQLATDQRLRALQMA